MVLRRTSFRSAWPLRSWPSFCAVDRPWPPKNSQVRVFIIGDGMAQPSRTSTEMFLAAKEGKPTAGEALQSKLRPRA